MHSPFERPQKIPYLVLLLVALLGLPTPIRAQQGTPKKQKITYPKLKKFVPAPYPPKARAEGREGVVKLILTISVKGTVTAVTVAVSAGDEFDQAAKTAALQWLFVPAKLDGKAIEAKIPISYPFKLKGKNRDKTPPQGTCDPKKDPKCQTKIEKGKCNAKTDPRCTPAKPAKPTTCDPKTGPKCTTPAPAPCDTKTDPKCKPPQPESCDPKANPKCTPAEPTTCDPKTDPKCTTPAPAPCDTKTDPKCKPPQPESCDPKTNPKCTPAEPTTCDPKTGIACKKKAPNLDPEKAKQEALQKASMGVLSGTLYEKGGSTRIEDAEIVAYKRLQNGQLGPRVASTFSGRTGGFTLSLAPGRYTIKILAPGCEDYQTKETVQLAERIKVRYYITRKEDNPYTTTIVGKKDRKEVTRYSVTLPEILAIPGTQGDALKAIQNMPGVARPPFGIGLIVVRGAAPADTKIYFEGHFIPQLYHFVGLTSVFNSDLLKKIDFIPGNFSPRYGNAMGGVIDVTTRKPKSDNYHGYLDLDIWDAGLLLEGPMPGVLKRGSFAISLRRSLIDSVIRPLKETLDIGIAPVYYDYQAIAQHPLFSGTFKLLFFGSDDRFLFLDSGTEPYKTDFQKVLGLWSRKWGKNSLKLSLSWGIASTLFETPQNNFNVNYDFNRTVWRLDYTRKFTNALKLSMGLDGTYLDTKITVRRSVIVGGDEEYRDDFREGFGSWSLTFQSKTLRQAAWTELDWSPLKTLSFYPGLRFDFWNDERGSHFTVDPRFTAKYDLLPKKLTLKAGVGLYTQTPDFFYYQKDVGNPELTHQNSLHVSTGLKYQALRSMSLTLTGFYKHLWDLVADTDTTYLNQDGVERRFNFLNSGYGRIYGMEFLLKKDNSIQCPSFLGFKKCFGWVSYTLLRSERQDTKGDKWYPYDFDQTHILTAIFSGKWPGGWTFGVRFRLTSGNPTTPFVGGFYDADRGRYVGIQGEKNSERLPLFHQLDVRVDKKFTFNRWSLTLYLDIQNIYNNQSTEFITYNFNYTKKTNINGLPIVPSIGLKGSF